MSKKIVWSPKKRILILGPIGLIILGLAAGAAYYFYTQNQMKQVEQKKVVADERRNLDDDAFRGDRDLAAEYTTKLQDEQPEAAYDIYEAEAAKLTDNAAKIALYEQAVAIAHKANQPDQAIKFSITLSELANNARASANVAYLYGLKKDYTNQRKYLQQALDQVEALPKDTPEYVSMKAYYQEQLSKVGTN
jgi:tetratricopeptide (TPR) repeat protein